MDLVVHAAVAFLFVYLLTRIIGRRELSSLQPFDLIIVVEDGKPITRNLDRNRITLEELAAAARQNQLDSLDDVRWAVLETNGCISFIPRSSYRAKIPEGAAFGVPASPRPWSGLG